MRKPQPILLVEGGPEDSDATKRALSRSGLTNAIFHCEDGDAALDFLYQRGRYNDPERAPRPGLILLDLNIPGTDGNEVLTTIKSDDSLKTIPVVVMSSSADVQDIEKCYRSGSNSYSQKPRDFSSLIGLIGKLKEYWFEAVILPKSE